jgi:hypothetical protein
MIEHEKRGSSSLAVKFPMLTVHYLHSPMAVHLEMVPIAYPGAIKRLHRSIQRPYP